MRNSMDSNNAKIWFGVDPPDLTLVSRARQPEWLYTYLRTFYRDDNRPYGVNNQVFKDVGMPHVFMDLQGLSECKTFLDNGACAAINLREPGFMVPAEYDAAIYDLVNFLAYTAEPTVLERRSLGKRVLIFIVIFTIFAWLLNREYWREIH